jgi:hypothetical protein
MPITKLVVITGIAALALSWPAFAGETRHHRSGSSNSSTTKVTTPHPSRGPGWQGRCHTPSCFGKLIL